MITLRNINILKHLSINKNSTIEELSQILNVSERTIRYDLENINYFLEKNNLPIIERLSKGRLKSILAKKQWDKLISSKSLYEMTSKEREDYLTIKLFLSRDYVVVSSLVDELEVGVTTINKDLKRLKERYRERGVDFESKSRKGVRVRGNEEVIREIQLSLILKYLMNYKKFILDLDYDISKEKILYELDYHLNLKTIEPIETFIRSIEQKMEKSISDEVHMVILAYMLVMILNVRLGNALTSIENENFISTTREHQIIKNTIVDLENSFSLEINRYELLMVTDFFLSSCFFNFGASYYDNWVKISFLTKRLINAMDREIPQSIIDDRELYKSLRNHLKPMMYRIKNNIKLKNCISSETKNAYKEYFECTKKACEILSEVLGTQIPESEIAFICLHFKLSIDRSKPKKSKNSNKKVLIVCGHGYGSSNLIAEELKKNFFIDIIGVIPVHLLDVSKVDDLDHIITTVPIEGTSGNKVIRINPIIQEDDFLKLRKLGFEKKKQKVYLSKLMNIIKSNTNLIDEEKLVKELLSGFETVVVDDRENKYVLKELLTDKHFLLNEECREWNEAVEKTVDILVDTDSVKKSYIDEIKDVVETLGEKHFMIGEGVALLHAAPLKSVNKTSFSLMTTSKPIKFPKGSMIDTFFCVATRDKVEHIDGLMELLDIIKVDNFKKKIMEIREPKEFYNIGREYT